MYLKFIKKGFGYRSVFGGKTCKRDSPNHMIDEIARGERKKNKKTMKNGTTCLEYRGLKGPEGRDFIIVTFDLST